MRNDLGNNKFLFNSEQRPNRQFNPNQRRPRGPVGPRRVEPRKKFIDDNLFLDPNLNKQFKEKKKFPRKIFLYIVIAIVIVAVLIGIVLLFIKDEKAEEPKKVKNKNIFVGSWNCKDYIKDGNDYKIGEKYILSLRFDNDNKFIFGSYTDLDNNYSIGTYKYNFLKNLNGDVSMYSLLLSSKKAVSNGKVTTGNFSSEFAAEISKKNGNMIIGNKKTKNVYICTSFDRTNPKIAG